MIQFNKSELKFLLHLYDIAKENNCNISGIKLFQVEQPQIYQINFYYESDYPCAASGLLIPIIIPRDDILHDDFGELNARIKKIILDNLKNIEEENQNVEHQ